MTRFFAFCSVLSLLALAARAQDDPNDGGPAPTSVDQVPLDGGATLLLASGVAYGTRRLRQRRRSG